MEEMIVVQMNPTEPQHTVYIISNNTETVPLIKTATIEELPSVVAMSAAKYEIERIRLAGAREYTCGYRDILTAKFETCFGKDNNIIIELM